MKKLTALCFVISLGLLAGNAVADETYTCTQGDQERIITIVYQDQAAKVPCEVKYQKGDVTETLWSAQSQAGYCEEKVEAFLEKQRGWGWDCAKAGEAKAEEGMMQQGTMEEGASQGMQEEMKESMQEEMKEGMQEEMKEGMQEESK